MTSVVAGPVAVLREIDRRASIAQRRLLVIGIEGAALLIAFAAFLATTRRVEVALGDSQLAYLSASAAQRLGLRGLEAALPAGLAVGVALAASAVWAEAVQAADGFAGGFTGSALPLATIAVLCGLGLAGTLVATAWGRAARASASRFGPLEAGALVALVVILWQASATGGLDTAVLAPRGAGVPVVLFVPLLAVVAGGVLLLRLLPLGFRALERLARRGPLAVRLALLGVVRRPTLAAGATTFLAVALGSALFSLNYRATLVDQGQAEAGFRAGAAWRTRERTGSAASVAPLTRYRALTREPPTPVIRTAATMDVVDDPIDVDVQVLGVPHDHVSTLSGWRASFTGATPPGIGRALAKPAARFRGPRIAVGATAIRLWARAPFQSSVTVRLLTDGQRFAALPMGGIGPGWRRLQVTVPRGLRGSVLASIEVGGSSTSSTARSADFGPLQQRVAGGRWLTASDLRDWEAGGPSGESVLVPAGFPGGPIARGIRVTFVPIGVSLIRPAFELPTALAALGGPDIPRGRVDLQIAGVHVPFDVVARSRLLPTVTEHPRRFVLVDYDTLFAYLNGTQPGLIEPSEAWFFSRPPPGLRARLGRAPFRSAVLVRRDAAERAARKDVLALDAQALLRTSGLESRAGAHPRELSGGEQQRVAVCAALIKGPKLALADEPTGQLDATHSKLVVDLLLELSAEAGASVLVVTHDPAIAARTARTVHVRDGRVSGEGAAEPALVVDRQGWLRLPRSVRDAAGIHQHVRASARNGAVVLTAEDAPAAAAGARAPAAVEPPRAHVRSSTPVCIEGLDKSYATQRIFRGLTHEFAPARLHVVAGPSGCGKTTLLDLIATLEVPDGGVIRIAGHMMKAGDARAAAAWRRRTLGHLSQHASLAGTLTARENVELGGAARGMAPREARAAAEDWLDWVGLAMGRYRPAALLSGREQRRVALARAVIGGPPLIVADEPTAHLDRANGAIALQLLKRAAAEHGATVIVSSHDPDALEAADEVLPLATVGSEDAPTCSAP